MKTSITLALMTATAMQTAAITPDNAIERRIDSIMSRMTIEEKIGQMTELTLDVIGHRNSDGQFEFNEDKLSEVIGHFKVGSILNVSEMALTRDEWHKVIGRIQQESMEKIGIPCIYGLDQNHGTTYTLGGTLFPQNINMAATFSTPLAEKAASITAYETRAGSCPWTYSPTLDLVRNPCWPRMWENFGEDCLMNAEMGKAFVRGLQGPDPNHIGQSNIASCLKHFMGYGAAATGKDRTPAYISPADLREKHFAPYLAAITEGAVSVMVNSGSINGLPVHANKDLLTDWLKTETGWDGMIVTDWADINNLYTRERVARDKKDAIRMAINAGIDMAMEPYATDFCTLLREIVEEGKVEITRIDDAVRRVLRLKLRLGLFEHPVQNPEDYPLFGSEAHKAVALQGATESMVLLKNNGVLPLKNNCRVLVTGPNADSMRSLNGGWSYSWQGDKANEWAIGQNTILQALRNELGSDRVVYEPGVRYDDKGSYEAELAPEIEKAVAAADKADIIIACIGENSYCETPGNLNDLSLSANQRRLVSSLAATGKPVVLILNEGRPRIISDIEPLADAVVEIMLPGNSGGDALAGLLTGRFNFSGRLPFTYPKHTNSLTLYDHKPSEQTETMSGAYGYDARVDVQWPFGAGMSYTTFAYSNLRADKTDFTVTDTLTVSVDVTNTGNVAGKEAVLLFSTDLVASITPDARRLRAFTKIDLKPGETKTVTFMLPASDLAFVDYSGKWVLEEGEFDLMAGRETLRVNCTATHPFSTPNR